MNNWQDLSPDSKVWVYGASRMLTKEEQNSIMAYLDQFCNEWAAHGAKLQCGFDILHDCIIVLAVDEHSAAASGCSIDKSVHAFQHIDKTHQLDLFNRLRNYNLNNDEVTFMSPSEVKAKLETGELTAQSRFVDPLVSTLSDVRQQLVKPIESTWLKKYL